MEIFVYFLTKHLENKEINNIQPEALELSKILCCPGIVLVANDGNYHGRKFDIRICCILPWGSLKFCRKRDKDGKNRLFCSSLAFGNQFHHLISILRSTESL